MYYIFTLNHFRSNCSPKNCANPYCGVSYDGIKHSTYIYIYVCIYKHTHTHIYIYKHITKQASFKECGLLVHCAFLRYRLHRGLVQASREYLGLMRQLCWPAIYIYTCVEISPVILDCIWVIDHLLTEMHPQSTLW